MTLRVATFPDWREANPYQRLLANALAQLDIEMTFPAGYRRVLPFSRQVLRGNRPDVLHLHWPSPYLRSKNLLFRTVYCLRTLFDLAFVQRAGIPIVWTVHNLVTHDTPTPRLERWFSARLGRLADGLIVHSTAAASEVAKELGGSEKKAIVIPHGSFRDAYNELPDRSSARAALGIKPDQPVALFFGFIRPYKGVPSLLRAWEALGAQRGEALLIIAGDAADPVYRDDIRALANTIPQVRLEMRYISDAEVPVLMAAADTMVLPFENSLTSGTVRLAKDYGVPVVVPRVPGTADIDGAILAENVGPETLGKAILEGLRTGRGIPAADNSWDEIARRHRLVYHEVLPGR